MSLSDDVPDFDSNGPLERDNSSSPANALFNGDAGDLSLETRRALVQLLAGPCLEQRRHPRLWPVLLRDEQLLRRRLSDVFLDLVVDHDLRVAFTRQAESEDLDVPVLLRRAPLTFLDSVLLLFLRQRLAEADAHGERAVVAREEMMEHLTTYERTASTDHAGFTKRMQASIEKIKKHSILQRIRSSEDRFEISPTLKILFSTDEIQALTELYSHVADGGTIPQGVTDPPETTDLDDGTEQ